MPYRRISGNAGAPDQPTASRYAGRLALGLADQGERLEKLLGIPEADESGLGCEMPVNQFKRRDAQFRFNGRGKRQIIWRFTQNFDQ